MRHPQERRSSPTRCAAATFGALFSCILDRATKPIYFHSIISNYVTKVYKNDIKWLLHI